MASIDQKFTQLKQEVDHLKQLLGSYGLPTEKVMSIPQAAVLTQFSEYQIRKEIKQAESMRLRDQPYDLKYGVHYFRDGKEIRVYPQKIREVLILPPDERMPFVEESGAA